MESYLIEKIVSVYPNAILNKDEKEQSWIKGVLPDGFYLEIMPNHHSRSSIQFRKKIYPSIINNFMTNSVLFLY
jgi:hypothetical protein